MASISDSVEVHELPSSQARESPILGRLKISIDIPCPIGHNRFVQVKPRDIQYYETPAGKVPAKDWLSAVKDGLTQAILYKRIRQAGIGQFGKTRSIGAGVAELKIDYGPGFRVYYGIHEDKLILILMAGSKRTQESDIKKAKAYWTEWKERNR